MKCAVNDSLRLPFSSSVEVFIIKSFNRFKIGVTSAASAALLLTGCSTDVGASPEPDDQNSSTLSDGSLQLYTGLTTHPDKRWKIDNEV